MSDEKAKKRMLRWRADWCLFCREVLKVSLDAEQEAILRSIQHAPMVAVSSGTSRGKDFVAACAALCFLYLTPRFDREGNLVKNTKVALTAPTGRQISNIMVPEFSRLFRNAKILPGRLVANDIRTAHDEWFLTGFKAGDKATEAWSGFHAVNTMFVVTEASGLPDETFAAIEGNLQGNSRLLLVFNPNITTGYAARAMSSPRFKKFRLNSLNAENVVRRKQVIPGQVNYEWVKDKVDTWCTPLRESDFNEGDGDFRFEGGLYRPNDLFRVKVLGMFPKTDTDVLIPFEWITRANERWREMDEGEVRRLQTRNAVRIGLDVAGMGRDSSAFCVRYGSLVDRFILHQSAGKADHMHVAGMAAQLVGRDPKAMLFIDTIGEGAGVFSRLREQGFKNAHSCKFSEGAKGLLDETGVYSFANMRAYLFWAIRDWLDPKNGMDAALPENDTLCEELTNIKWRFTSSGSIMIEPKDDIKARIGRSPDLADCLANTFYPKHEQRGMTDEEILDMML